MLRSLRTAMLDLWALLSPVDCAGCDAPDRTVCAACAPHLIAEVTARPIADGAIVHTALDYESVVRRVILALKEQDRTDAATPLAAPLAAAIAAATAAAPTRPTPIEIAAVPSGSAGKKSRGYEPVRLLLRRARVPAGRILIQRRRTATQKSMSIEQRALNREGSMVAVRRLDGRRFIIVDDVVTTGSTLTEAARAIRAAGGHVAGMAALAYTPRRYPVS